MTAERSPVILRPAQPGDASAIVGLLAPAVDELVGMGSLPLTIDAADQACEETADTVADLATGSFALADGHKRRVLFVAIDTETQQLLGVTGVTFKQAVPNLGVQVSTSRTGDGLVMSSSSTNWTRTELDSSFLGPHGRGQGLGTLLSRGRFMLLHVVQHQIPNTVASHLRGRFGSDASAPFWKCFGAQIAPQWATSDAAERALAAEPELLTSLAGHVLPLTAEVLDSLGPVNAASLPAFHLLMAEGLTPNGMYDPIDGGPTVTAHLATTATATRRSRGRAAERDGHAVSNDAVDALVSVGSIDRFRVIRAHVNIDPGPNPRIVLGQRDADALGVSADSLVAICPLGAPQ
jgi:arginine N-succinyltransferase